MYVYFSDHYGRLATELPPPFSLFLAPSLSVCLCDFSTNFPACPASLPEPVRCPFITLTTMRPFTRHLATALLRPPCTLPPSSSACCQLPHRLPSVYFRPLQDSSRHNVRCKVCLWSSGLCFIYMYVYVPLHIKRQQQLRWRLRLVLGQSVDTTLMTTRILSCWPTRMLL